MIKLLPAFSKIKSTCECCIGWLLSILSSQGDSLASPCLLQCQVLCQYPARAKAYPLYGVMWMQCRMNRQRHADQALTGGTKAGKPDATHVQQCEVSCHNETIIAIIKVYCYKVWSMYLLSRVASKLAKS